MKVLGMQLPALARHVSRVPLPLAFTLLLGCAGLAVVSWMFFFDVHIAVAMMAVASARGLVTTLARDGAPSPTQEGA